MNRKEMTGLSAVLLGVACLAIGIFQLNAYLTLSNLAGSARDETNLKLEQIRNDPAQLAALGISKDELDQYGPQLLSQIESGIKALNQQAGALVPIMVFDFVVGAVLVGGGVHLASERKKP